MTSVEQIAQQELGKHGVMKGVKVEHLPKQGKPQPSFEAFTDLSTNQTTLKYDPEFQLPPHAAHFARAKNVSIPLETCIRDIVGHECGHIHNTKRRSCPETLEDHEEHFYEPAAVILKKHKKLGAIDSVANHVEDLVDNTLLAQGPHAGLSIFYKDVATTTGWQPAYEAYMRIQLYCWGDEKDKQLLTPHFTKNPEVTKAAQAFLRNLESLAGGHGRLASKEVATYVADKSNWKAVTKAFVKALEPLIEQQMQAPMCGFGKQMRKSMKDPANREKLAKKSYTQGKKRPSWMPKEEALDAVYSALAREIQVKVETPRKAMSLPVVPYQYEAFDSEEHAVSQINFRKSMIVPERDTPFGLPGLNFGVPQRYIEKALLVKKGITSFPEFKCAYLDASVSMKEGIPNLLDAGSATFIPWGDKSKYHYLCKAWYGIVEYLARQQILPNVNVTLGAFSDDSRVSHGLEAAKKLLFSPQFKGTSMDPAALGQLFEGGKSVFFTVSDGDIINWDAVKQDFITRAKEHYYFHIQLGPGTAMTKDLRKAGLPVYNVQTGEDLEHLAIDLTRNAYQSYINEVLEHLR